VSICSCTRISARARRRGKSSDLPVTLQQSLQFVPRAAEPTVGSMFQSAARANPPRPISDVDGSQLQPYFRELASHGVMSAEDEVAAAHTIAALRRCLWTTILGHAPAVAAITELIGRRVAADEALAADIAALLATSRALRDRDLKAHQDAYTAAQGPLVAAMLRLDVDGHIADEIAAELAAIAAGRAGERTLILPAAPRQGSRPFAAYVQAIQATLAELRAARGAFVAANLRLVVTIARRYTRGSMSLADRIQEGNLGLIKAVCRFDPARGFRFATYGAWWIKHAIGRAMAEKDRAIRLPVHLVAAMHRLARARRELRGQDGGEPANEAVAAHTGLSLARIERLDIARHESTISLEPSQDGGSSRELHDALADDELPGERLDAEVIQLHLREAFATLRPLEADILRQRFGLADDQTRTLRELAAQYSLSRERIRQLQEQALGKIRHELRRHEVVA